MGIPTLATALIKVLARRGERIAAALAELGYQPLEVYPFATLRLLGLPWRGKKTPGGPPPHPPRPEAAGPRAQPPQGLGAPARLGRLRLTALLWRQGRTRTVGRPEEGLMVIPDVQVL